MHPHGARRSGSILITLVAGLLVFVAVWGIFASGQVTHARRLDAEYGHLQAIYAAESAIYASMVARADVATTTLWTDGTNTVTYAGNMELASAPTWITGTGRATIQGGTYVVTVKGYTLGSRILLWDFNP